MKKNLPIIATVVAIIILAAAGYMFLGKNKSVDNTSQTEKSMDEKNKSVMDEFLGSNVSMQCNYTDPERGEVVAYLKNGNVRMDYKDENQETGSAIIKDKTIYFWNSQGAFKMAVPDEDELKEATGSSASNPSDFVESIEQYKQYCKNTSVDDSRFDLPKGVTFQDFSEYTNSMMNDESSSEQSTPSKEEIEKLMQQYQNQGQ